MSAIRKFPARAVLGAATTLLAGAAAWAAPRPVPPPPPQASYADIADLADSAPLVLTAEIRRASPVEAARAPGLRPGWVRLYVEARTRALITGSAVIGEQLRYLVDLPLEANRRAPAINRRQVIVFARLVPGRPGELQLVKPNAQLLWSPELEAQVRGVVAELVAPGHPPRVTGVREAIHQPGTLRGEGETQIFLATSDESAGMMTVTRRPGQLPAWGVTFSEISDGALVPPAANTLAWYRLACFLPPSLPPGSNLSETPADRAAAEGDYRFILGELGPCPRLRNW